MAEVCDRCGNGAVVDSTGSCFRCTDIEGVKYIKKKTVISEISMRFFMVLDILVSFFVLCKFEPRIFFTIVYCCVIGFVLNNMIAEKMDVMTVAIADIVFKLLLSVIGQELISDFFEEATRLSLLGLGWAFIIRPIIVIIVLCIILSIEMGISCIWGFKNNEEYKLMNDVLDKESKLSKTMAQIPKYQGGYTQEEYNKIFYNDLDRVMELVSEVNVDDEAKKEAIRMFQTGGDVESDVAGQYCYLEAIKMLIEETLPINRKDKIKNQIVNDKTQELLPIVYSYTINAEHQKYVTEKYFELCNRIQKEINEPYNYFLQRNNELQVYGWYEKFKKVYTKKKNGYIGEKRVEKSLQKYDEQIIVLPGIRIKADENTSEIDFVLISQYGVYSLEVKNLSEDGNYDVLIEQDGRWSKVINDEKTPMKSPDLQNENHIYTLGKVINRALGRSLDNQIVVNGMIVIANDNVTINNQNPDCIVKRYDYVMQSIRQNPIVLKESDMKQIAEIVQNAAIEHAKFSLTLDGVERNLFDTYFYIKMLMREYTEWKQGNQELFDYVSEYQNNVYDFTYREENEE